MSGLLPIDYKTTWVKTSLPSLVNGSKFVVASGANTMAKLAASAFSLFSLSGETQLNNWANKGFSTVYSAKLLLPSLFFMSIRLFNPFSQGMEAVENDKCQHKMTGTLTLAVAYPLFKRAIEEADNEASPNLRKHVLSRIFFLTGTALVTLTKAMEIGLGLLLCTLGWISFGHLSWVNQAAIVHLSALDVIEDVCAGLRGCVNPWTDLGRQGKMWGDTAWAYRKQMWLLDSRA